MPNLRIQDQPDPDPSEDQPDQDPGSGATWLAQTARRAAIFTPRSVCILVGILLSVYFCLYT